MRVHVVARSSWVGARADWRGRRWRSGQAGLEPSNAARAVGNVVARRPEREAVIGDQADTDIAGALDDRDLLLHGQLAHGPGAEGEAQIGHAPSA